jgi:hypothetical protein
MQMLTPEEKEMLANIKGLVAQIEQMEGGAGDQGGAPIMESADDNPDMFDGADDTLPDNPDDQAAQKACGGKVKKAEGGAVTADDDAEERINVPESNSEKAINEIAKAIIAAVNKTAVKKSVQVNPMIQTMNDLTRVVKSLVDRQEQQGAALESILEGFGIVSDVKKSVAGEKVEKAFKPIPANSGDAMEMLAQMLGVKKAEEKPENFDVKKGLGDVLTVLGQSYRQS